MGALHLSNAPAQVRAKRSSFTWRILTVMQHLFLGAEVHSGVEGKVDLNELLPSTEQAHLLPPSYPGALGLCFSCQKKRLGWGEANTVSLPAAGSGARPAARGAKEGGPHRHDRKPAEKALTDISSASRGASLETLPPRPGQTCALASGSCPSVGGLAYETSDIHGRALTHNAPVSSSSQTASRRRPSPAWLSDLGPGMKGRGRHKGTIIPTANVTLWLPASNNFKSQT